MNGETPNKEKDISSDDLTRDQKLLLYTIDYLGRWVQSNVTISNSDDSLWIKELPLWAIVYYQIIKGTYETYDYAPTATTFFGRSSYTINLSYEALDDIEDMRKLYILEKIRLSTSQHGFITGYRITTNGKKILEKIPQDAKDEIHNLFYCSECKTHIDFLMDMSGEPDIKIDCPVCDDFDTQLDFMISEDVSYKSKPYFLKSGNLLVKED